MVARVAATLMTAVVVSLVVSAVAAARPTLIVHYKTIGTCTIYPNYPKAGVLGNSGRTWTIPAGREIKWRYNVNSTWSMVSDPSRSSAGHFPWWGFARKDCIGRSVKTGTYPAGRPVPNRILSGRSQRSSGWRPVDLSVAPAPVKARNRQICSTATLRDPANFVIGNVFPGWHVDETASTRTNGHWVKVYVPNAKRWGYVERGNLEGCESLSRRPAAPTCGSLESGSSLTSGQALNSCDGRFVLTMQPDGNLVLWQHGVGALWSSRTSGTSGRTAIMQPDGNFVVYDASHRPLWHSDTFGHQGARLALQPDGNLVVYSTSGAAVWNSNTCCR